MTSPPASVSFTNGNQFRRSANNDDPLNPTTSGVYASGGINSREVEQRIARTVAEYEYKLLEERGRAQERETRLLEELQREKSQLARVRNELSQQQQEQGGNEGRVGHLVSKDEYEQLRQQLQDTRQLLQEAERRYQQEKRELLNLRTAQLRNETSKRGQEGDIIARAMQVMSEYEVVVRNSEETSLARLAHHMETFEKEWIRRSREFEEQKIAFETSMLEKTRQTMAEHEHDVETISRALLEKTVKALRDQSEMRLEIEEQVMRHAEIFKEEYKAILDKEFYDRCRMSDEKIADRERNWVKVLQEERKKIIAAEQQAVKEHETLHVKALEDAMRDLSRLREQLVREHQEQQTEAMKELIAQRENLQRDHEQLIENMNKKTQEMQQKCMIDVVDAQNKIKELHVRMSAKEAEMARRLHEAEHRADQVVLAKIQEIRNEVEQQWSLTLEKERAKYADEIQQVSKEYQSTIDRIRSEHVEREGALLASYEQRVVRVEEAAESRWSGRVEEAMLGLERHMEVVQMLRRDNETMAARIDSLTQEVQLKAAEMEGAVGRARREQDVLWHQKIEEMRQRYDKLLDEALRSTSLGDMSHVSQTEYNQALQSVKEWEERCVTLKQEFELRLEQEREQMRSLWGKRMEEERTKRAEWEAQQLQHFTAMRNAFLQDMEAAENSAAATQRAESDALQEAFLQQQREERRRSDAAIAQAQAESRERCAAVRKEQEEAFQERTRQLEERIAQWELDVQHREEELQQTSLRVVEEAQQKASNRLREERQAMQILYDKKFAELHDEQQRWESKTCIMQQQLTAQYADQFVKAKTDMQQHLLAVVATMLSYQEECEATWLHTRESELEEFGKERLAYRKLMESRSAADIARVQAQVKETIKSERDALNERERILHETLQANQKIIEDGATERAIRLLQEQQHVLQENNRLRAQEQQQSWEGMENALLEKMWATEADQRAEMQKIQREHEVVLEKERQRWRTAEQQLRAEAQAQKQQLIEELRQREAELHATHASTMEAERRRHEAYVAELRKEHERRLADDKQRAEGMQREREAVFEAERRRLLERMETQSREQQESANERVRVMQEEFHNLMRSATAKSQQSQQDYLTQVEELQQRYVFQLEEQKKELCRRHEESLNAMHLALEARVREQAVVEADVQRRVEEERASLREEMEAKYRAFIEEQSERVRAEQQVREENARRMECMYHDQLAALRTDMEETLSTYFAQSDNRAQEAATESRADFEKKIQAFYALLEEERRQRLLLEEKLRESHSQIDALQLTHEQQKLKALQEVQAKYDDVYKEMRDALRAEREEWARRALGEEEQRLLRELTSREERRRRQVDTPSYATKATTSTVGLYALPSEGTPTASKQQQRRGPEDVIVQQSVRLTPRTPRDLAIGDVLYDVDDMKLQQLWSVLEVPEGERQQMVRRWSQLPLPQRLAEVQKETRRLELQLPLLEVVTRREFVIHRLKELENSSSINSTQGTQQMGELRQELLRLTEHLKSEIPRHEAKYGCTFRFRGTRYMDSLL